VGYYGPSIGARRQTLVEHWNGTAWTKVSSSNPGVINVLTGVAALPSNAGAVGYYSSGTSQPLAVHL
jgi:hypothetical protein